MYLPHPSPHRGRYYHLGFFSSIAFCLKFPPSNPFLLDCLFLFCFFLVLPPLSFTRKLGKTRVPGFDCSKLRETQNPAINIKYYFRHFLEKSVKGKVGGGKVNDFCFPVEKLWNNFTIFFPSTKVYRRCTFKGLYLRSHSVTVIR